MKRKQDTATPPKEEKVYLPFYLLLDHLPGAPREAFVSCQIKSRFSQLIGGENIVICEILLTESDKSIHIPEHLIITKPELSTWGQKIADWFIESAKKHTGTA
jgi:hypothetical protein